MRKRFLRGLQPLRSGAADEGISEHPILRDSVPVEQSGAIDKQRPRLAGDEFPGSCPYHGDCVEGLAAGPSLVARVGAEQVRSVLADDPVWQSVAWALAQLCHAIVCAAAPRAIAIGGGVLEKQPHLLGRVDEMLVESLNGYMMLPTGQPYIRAPELGPDAGPLGAIALAMNARR